MKLSRIILLMVSICIPFSSGFAACWERKMVTIHNDTGINLGTTVDNDCACHAQNAFDTGGPTKRSFTSAVPLVGRMKGDTDGSCGTTRTRWLSVDFYLPSGAKFAHYKYNTTNQGLDDYPFDKIEISPSYQPYFEWTQKREEGGATGTATITLACKATVGKQKCEDVAFGRERQGNDLP